MKKVLVHWDRNKLESMRYLRGHLYGNSSNVIVLCIESSNKLLWGVILDCPGEPERIGEKITVSIDDCPYDEFHGSVVLEN